MSWRLKGWNVFQIVEANVSECHCAESWVEAGADAMLQALKDARFPYTGNQFVGIEITEDGQLLIILKS